MEVNDVEDDEVKEEEVDDVENVDVEEEEDDDVEEEEEEEDDDVEEEDPKTGATLCASLRRRNAFGHCARAILCGIFNKFYK